MGFTGAQLFPILWEVTRTLDRSEIKVKSWTCDGVTPVREFLRINSDGLDQDYYTRRISDWGGKNYFFSDVPHLLKTTRSSIENSHGNTN